jgi:hypothetical protein
LDQKLNNLETLVEKNKRNLKLVRRKHDKLEGIVRGVKESMTGDKVSDDIKLYFALMRGNKLHLAEEISDLKELRSRTTDKEKDKYIMSTRKSSKSPNVCIIFLVIKLFFMMTKLIIKKIIFLID